VLRLDDRGVGSSSGKFSTATSEDFAGDVLAAVTFLKSRPHMDPRRIGLIGHSEGGLIAPMVARRSNDVAFMRHAGGARSAGDSILILQGAADAPSGGVERRADAREIAARRRLHALVKAGADSTALMPAMRELIEVQTAELDPESRKAIGDPDSMAWGATRLVSRRRGCGSSSVTTRGRRSSRSRFRCSR
jgi:pimeloyl-ACP methyl ester carboxylesterase